MTRLNMDRSVLQTLSFVSLCILILSFQNCGQNPGSDESSRSTAPQYNGYIYEGKTFVVEAPLTCTDGKEIEAAIVYFSDESAQQVRANCQDLAQPILLTTGQFFVDPTNVDILIYNFQSYVSEPTAPLSISKKSDRTTIQTLANTGISSGNFSVLPTTGDLVVCHLQVCDPSLFRLVDSVSDTYGNAFVRGGYSAIRTNPFCNAELWYATNISAGTGAYSVQANYGKTIGGRQTMICSNFQAQAGKQLIYSGNHFANYEDVVPGVSKLAQVHLIPNANSGPRLFVGGVLGAVEAVGASVSPGGDGFATISQPAANELYNYKAVYETGTVPVIVNLNYAAKPMYLEFALLNIGSPAPPPVTANVELTSDKSAYLVGEQISISFNLTSPSTSVPAGLPNDYITVHSTGVQSDYVFAVANDSGQSSGTLVIPAAAVTGSFDVVYRRANGSPVGQRAVNLFSVQTDSQIGGSSN